MEVGSGEFSGSDFHAIVGPVVFAEVDAGVLSAADGKFECTVFDLGGCLGSQFPVGDFLVAVEFVSDCVCVVRYEDDEASANPEGSICFHRNVLLCEKSCFNARLIHKSTKKRD